MGMFDSVLVPCPTCKKLVEFQSKADVDPSMNDYTVDTAPDHILRDVTNWPVYHVSCGTWVAIIDPRTLGPTAPAIRPQSTVAVIKPPDVFESHFQGFRWWPDGRELTIEDIDTSDAQSRDVARRARAYLARATAVDCLRLILAAGVLTDELAAMATNALAPSPTDAL